MFVRASSRIFVGGGGGGWVARANGPNEFIMSCLGAYHPYMKQ